MNWMMIVAALGIMGVLGAVFGVVLSIADKKFAVEVDPRVSAVRAVLGGANCGACGFAGCDAFAEAVVNGEAKPDGCPASDAAGAAAMPQILGLAAGGAKEAQFARVYGQGTCEAAKAR